MVSNDSNRIRKGVALDKLVLQTTLVNCVISLRLLFIVVLSMDENDKKPEKRSDVRQR